MSGAYDGEAADALARRWALPAVRCLADTPSTMDVAHAAAREGAPDGLLVVADRQGAARGQGGRRWEATHDGVWCSWLRRPTAAQPLDRATLDVLTIRCGLGVAAQLDRLLPGAPAVRLKWPNDLLVGEAKVGGILVEATWDGERLSWLVIGVGVNRQPPSRPIDAEALPPGGLPGLPARLAILEAVVQGLREATWPAGHLRDDERRAFAARDALVGRRLAAPVAGEAAGITPDGALRVRDAAGTWHAVRSGPVRLAGTAARRETPGS